MLTRCRGSSEGTTPTPDHDHGQRRRVKAEKRALTARGCEVGFVQRRAGALGSPELSSRLTTACTVGTDLTTPARGGRPGQNIRSLPRTASLGAR
jgi:hypothetical protein